MKLLERLLTKNKTQISLYYVNFDYNKYRENGEICSCMAHLHPLLRDDEELNNKIKDTIDYIRINIT